MTKKFEETKNVVDNLSNRINISLWIGLFFLIILILSLFFMEVAMPLFNLIFGSNGAFIYSLYLLLSLILTLVFVIFGLRRKTEVINESHDNKLAVSMIILISIFFVIVIGMILALAFGDS